MINKIYVLVLVKRILPQFKERAPFIYEEVLQVKVGNVNYMNLTITILTSNGKCFQK
jgi:hypothetical protein